MAEAVYKAYVAEHGSPPSKPQQLVSYAKKNSSLPQVKYGDARRYLDSVKGAASPPSSGGGGSKRPTPKPPTRGGGGGVSSAPTSKVSRAASIRGGVYSPASVRPGKGGKKARKQEFKRKLQLSKAARQAGRNEDAIKVNMESIMSKPKFSRMVIYNVNCLANLAENPFNSDFMMEKGMISMLKELMLHHKGNATVMKEISRLVANVAKANPEHADALAESGILDDCLDIVKNHAEACGSHALEMIDAVLKNASNPHAVAEDLQAKGAVPIIMAALDKGMKDGGLAGSLVKTLNGLTKADRRVGTELGRKKHYKPVLGAMEMNPAQPILAINGVELTSTVARLDPEYLAGIKAAGAVPIISKCMQANPYLSDLKRVGKEALALLAGEDDLTRALNVLYNFEGMDGPIISECLGLLGNLALIAGNADYFASKGAINGLLGLINFKCRAADAPGIEDLGIIADATRALGPLLMDPKTVAEFDKVKGMDHLSYLLKRFGDEEVIMNSTMDALENLAHTDPGKLLLLNSGILPTAVSVMAANPEYDVMMRKFNNLLAQLPDALADPALFGELVKAGLLDAVTSTLLARHDDPETVMACADVIKQVVLAHPELAPPLAANNAYGLIQSIRAHCDNPDVLAKIFGAISAMAAADPTTLDILKKHGLEAELDKILKQDGISPEVRELVDEFKQGLIKNNFTDLDEALEDMDMELGDEDYAPELADAAVVEEIPEEDELAKLLEQMGSLARMLDNPEFSKKFVSEGKVTDILDSIQEYYDKPEVVNAGLLNLMSCCMVPGAFATLEDIGVPEAVVQCMLEHPDDLGVQLLGLQLLAKMAAHEDALVAESLCQPITIDTILKSVDGNIENPDFCHAFADYINNLLQDVSNGPHIAQQLVNEGIPDIIHDMLAKHSGDVTLVPKLEGALANIDHYTYKPPPPEKMGAELATYGTVTMTQLAGMDLSEMGDVISEWSTEEVMTTMRAARDPRLVQSGAQELNKRMAGGDHDTYSAVVSGGGITDLLNKAMENMDHTGALGASLDALGTLSGDDRLKTLLGMHGLIRLVLETIRRNPSDILLLDKCCYILSNLTYNNMENMTQVMELGGTTDIVSILKRHRETNFLCESALGVLVNLCHQSDKNKTMICRYGGAKAAVAALRTHHRCLSPGDDGVCSAAFRLLANLAFVEENVKQLLKQDVVAVVMETMDLNADKRELIQMGVMVLANLSSHDRVAPIMVRLGVLDLIINVSKAYPEEIEIQKSCLGCVGNLMNEASNAVSFLDKSGHLRVFQIMEELVFEETVTTLCLRLLKVLSTNADIATQLAESGGLKAVVELIAENKGSEAVASLGCQALCKMIVTLEVAKECLKEGVIDLMCELSVENDNWANIIVMGEVVKVIVNTSVVEENAVTFAKKCGVPFLRSIEAHSDNAVFLQSAAMALSKLSIHPNASRTLVKRGAIAVICSSARINIERRGVLARYLRSLTNFLYTEHRSADAIAEAHAEEIFEAAAAKHSRFEPLQKELADFHKAVKLKASKVTHTKAHYTASVRDQLEASMLRMLTGGQLMRKHEKGKTKKRSVRVNEDCSLLLFEDPEGKKAAKQLNLKTVQLIEPGNLRPGFAKKTKPETCFAIISLDPNGREFAICLETRTDADCGKWIQALEEVVNLNKTTGAK